MKRHRNLFFFAVLAAIFAGLADSAMAAGAALDASDTFQPRNTQAPGDAPPSPHEALASLKLPPGFTATLFAGDPDVRQPIDMKVDDRGRVWVCEAYSYKEWQKKGEDRIVIFTDTDGDGDADERKIFRGGFNHLSSVEIGFGGVWVLDTPRLLFFPDKNGDDIADGEPEVLLEGWTEKGGHNLVNGLQWGIDGWLYGRHGITEPSVVGKPGAAEKDRTFIEPGIWRIHPVSRKFEVLVRGSTNPWGLDWDEHGEMFMSGNVNGHLWHCIPGALFERMFGAGSVPHDYERLKMIGETTHYPTSGDWKQDWLKPDKGRDAANALGGGHSHCGLLICQGGSWPAEFRGQFFMCNTHGRRINQEAVRPSGCSFVSKHAGDPFVFQTPWFRGVSLIGALDGSVLVSDWTDNGECHDDDGVHRTSGRIYRIFFGKPPSPDKIIVPERLKSDEAALVALQSSDNEVLVRKSRRLLQEMAVASGGLGQKSLATLRKMLAEADGAPRRLRALWTLHACGAFQREDCTALLRDAAPSLRVWAARFLADDHPGNAAAALVPLAESDSAPLVLAHLAGIVPKLPPDDGWRLAQALLRRKELAADHTLELLVWYAVEPLAKPRSAEIAVLAPRAGSLLLTKFLSRRLAAEMDDSVCREAAGSLLTVAAETGEPAVANAILSGMRDGLSGRTNVPAPANWPKVVERLLARSAPEATALGLAFGDGKILDLLREMVGNSSRSAAERCQALASLTQAKVPDLSGILQSAFGRKELRLAAIRGYAAVPDASAASQLLEAWPTLSAEEKVAVVDTLSVRIGSSVALLEALGAGKIQRSELSAMQVRHLANFKNKKVQDLLAQHWGKLTATGDERKAEIARYKNLLASGQPGDAARGRDVFRKTCSACHSLFGDGGKLGPDLTGTGRKDAEYILLNVLDPNAVVPRDYQLTVVTLKDGRVLSGAVPHEDDKTVTLQSLAERTVLERSAIARIERQPLSWMPEGLFAALGEQEFRDLMKFLASDAPPPP